MGSSSHLVKWFQAFHVCLKMRISFGIHDAESKQIEFGAAVHGAFDQLQAVNMSFDWSVAPRMLKSGQKCSLILAKVLGKAGQRTRFRVFFPLLPSNRVPLPDDTNELPCKRSTGSDF